MAFMAVMRHGNTTVHENGSLSPKEKGASPVDLYIYLNRKFKTCLFAQDRSLLFNVSSQIYSYKLHLFS